MNMYYFRSKGGRGIAILMAVIMALTIYSGIGLTSGSVVHASGDSGPAEVSQKEAAATTAPAPKGAAAKVKENAVANEIIIKSVEVLTRGDFQDLYRDSVHKGDPTKGEDPSKYYTTYREFNLKDPRIFSLEFTVDSDDVTAAGGDTAYLNAVALNYGGFPLSAWGNGNNLRGTTAILIMSNKNIIDNGDGTHTITMDLRQNSPWATSAQNTNNNIPFANYYGGNQSNFGSGQNADNRAWWQAGPAYKGCGSYELEAKVSGNTVASTNMHIGPYDEMYSWVEMNEFAQDIIEAINGKSIPIEELDKRPIGTLAKGYVTIDKDGNFVKGNRSKDVYVEVSIIGYGLTDNYKSENAGYNNYSRFNPQWNVVVSYDENKVDEYLNETVPTMNENPQKLIDKYKNADPKDIDMMNVFYQNNVHSDEVTGTDTSMKLIKDMIEGGKAGKKIKYKTMDESNMNFFYRQNAAGYSNGTNNHRVKGDYGASGDFMSTTTRKSADFDTKEALDKFIFVTTLCSNPDGKAGMRRVNRYGLDMNRDVVFSTQPETISLTKDIAKWDPLVLNEWHGYVAQMLIEPCTAPHAPTFEYDLLQNNMLQLAYKSGYAITGSTGYVGFRIPWDHQDGGDWDDGGTIYAPMFAMLFGTYGYTIEFPHSNTDSFEAGNVINYAMVNELLTGSTHFYPGNRLNGALTDLKGATRDSHQVDNKHASMRKSSVLNKLEVKRRGVENIDSMDADKYFIDKRPTNWVVVGRDRPVDKDGETLSYFPDYLVIPADSDNQYNIAEGIKGINHMIRLGAKVSISTEDIEYDGKKIPKGAYVFDMKQGNRNLIFEIMGKGYDATFYPSMYADIYCNYPDVRGFDSVQVYGDGLFKGKLLELDKEVDKKADISGKAGNYVVFKSQSTDAVRFVNLLLSGRSSGPSFADKGDVWMLRNHVEGVGQASDYVIKAEDLSKIKKLVDNVDLGLIGCHIEGQYVDKLPKEAVKLVEPVIQFNTARTAQSGGVLWWALDDYLGFGSMADYDGGTNLRSGANVVVSNNATPSAAIITAIKNQKMGLIMLQSPAALTNANFGTGNTNAPSTGSLGDVAVNGDFNINDSLFSANYEKTKTLYARGNYYTTNIPAGSKVLFKSLSNGSDAFIGGWQATSGAKTTFGDRTMIFSTLLKGGGITGKPTQALVMGQNQHNRSHYQKLLPMLATGIYAGAAGIIDDLNPPEFGKMTLTGNNFKVNATEPSKGVLESDLDSAAIYLWNGEKFALKKELKGLNGVSNVDIDLNADADVDQVFKVVATDFAGNEGIAYFSYDVETREIKEIDAKDVRKLSECIVTVEATEGGEVAGDGTYKLGDVIQVSAKADKGYDFLGWYNKDTDTRLSFSNNYSFTARGDINLIAKFEKFAEAPEYTVTITADAGGAATGAGLYKAGEVAQLSAKADKGYEFLGWVDDDSGATISFSSNYSLVVKGDMNIVAKFADNTPSEYTIGVTASAGGEAAGAGKYKEGEVAKLSAKADKGYEFIGWFNDVSGTRLSFSANFDLTVKGDMSIIAKFAKIEEPPILLTECLINVVATEGGEVAGGGLYEKGGTANLSLKAAKGYEFIGWFDADTEKKLSHNPNYSFTVKDGMTIIAKFVRDLEGATMITLPAKIVYDGKAKEPAVLVSFGTTILTEGTHYNVTHSNNTEIGEASVTITGIGNHVGEKTTTYQIVPKTTAVTKAKVGKKSLTVTWEKVAGDVTSYQINYKVKGKAKWKSKTVPASKAKIVLKKLKKGKKYKVRVRSFKTVNDVKYYSDWSKVKISKKIK